MSPEVVSVRVADGVHLHAVVRLPEAGATAAPVLLVHGLASNARLWDGTADALVRHGHPVVAIDQRGHGRSDKPDHGYDFATLVDDLVALITSLGLHRPLVVGQSWGGNVVVELAASRPDVLCGAVAVDGGFIELADAFATWDECCEALTPPRLAGTAATTMERWVRDAHPDWPESGILGSLANFEVRGDGTIAPWLTLDRHLAILHELYRHHPSARFPHVQVPMLLVPADTGDVAWTRDKRHHVDRALHALPHGRVHWFSPADHDLHAQHPDRLAEVLHDFAQECTTP